MDNTIFFQSGELKVNHFIKDGDSIIAIGVFKDHLGYRWEAMANIAGISSDCLINLPSIEICKTASVLAQWGDVDLILGKGL